MSTTNIYRALRELLPEPPLLVATVTSINPTDGTSLISFPGGLPQIVRGTNVAEGSNCFVRNGVIESAAPTLPLEIIEV